MTIKTFITPALAALILSGCQMTGDPMTDRAAVGAAGGAVIGNLLGGDTESTLAGALLGGAAGAATAQGRRTAAAPAASGAHPCQDIFDAYPNDGEARSGYCEERLYLIKEGRYPG